MSSSSFSSLSLSGKVAVVTGSTSGMGASTAELLAARGAKVVVSGRRQKDGDTVVERIRAAGGDAIFVQTDVAVEADVQRLIATAVKHYGHIDIAFNNAGVLDGVMTPPHATSNDAFNRLFDINVRGLHWCIKYEAEQFLRQRSAAGITGPTSYNGAERVNPNALFKTSHPYSIVNNASVWGVSGTDFAYAYSGTKFAVVGLSRSAALNYAKMGIRVNAVCPGLVWSEMSEGAPVDALLAANPIGRVGQSQEIAEAVAFLSSNAASLITGAAIPVDGGNTA